MGEPENPHFHDLRIFGRVHGSQNQLVLSLEALGYRKEFKKIPNHFENVLSWDIFEFVKSVLWEKTASDKSQDLSYFS